MGEGRTMEINFHVTNEGVVVRFRKENNGLGTATLIPFSSVSPGCMDYFISSSCMICKDECPHRTPGNGLSGCMVESILAILSAGLTDSLTGLPGRIVLIPQIEHLIDRERIFLQKVIELQKEMLERGITVNKNGNPLINLLIAAKKLEQEKVHTDLVEKGLNLSRITAVLMIDIDRFKIINDTFGHPAGDSVLKGVGNILSSSIKASDWTARYGGEEFVVVLHNITLSELRVVCERLLTNVREGAITYLLRHILRENKISFNRNANNEELLAQLEQINNVFYHSAPSQITVSIGVSISGDWDLDSERADANNLLTLSDLALYAAKERRNSASFFQKR